MNSVSNLWLSPLAEQAKAHWKEHRSQMYAELEKAGTLNEAAQRAADQTNEELCSAIYDGMSWDPYLYFAADDPERAKRELAEGRHLRGSRWNCPRCEWARRPFSRSL